MRRESNLAMAVSEDNPHHMEALDSPHRPMLVASPGLKEATASVWNALNGRSYDWRSVAGIAKETGLDPLAVTTILERQLGDAVVRAVDKDQPGTFLYATRERYNKIRGPWNRVLSLITNQVK
jgi:hypothetical protein